MSKNKCVLVFCVIFYAVCAEVSEINRDYPQMRNVNRSACGEDEARDKGGRAKCNKANKLPINPRSRSPYKPSLYRPRAPA